MLRSFRGSVSSRRICDLLEPEGQGPTGTAIREGRTCVCNDLVNDRRMVPWRESGADLGIRAGRNLAQMIPEIVSNIRSDLPPVLADPTQIHQVLMNLCTNAAHAMRDKAGRLEVRLEPFQADEHFVASHPDLRAGPHVRLTVSDTGHGMEAETLRRIFEPFFTTKGPGEGTGLGLAVVHGIVQEHQGAISVYSRPGQGTTFHVCFPVLAAEGRQVIDAQSANHPRARRTGSAH